MKTLVVYYSRTGITRKVAAEIAQRLEADLEEIIDLKSRRGAWEYLKAGRDAMKRLPAEIGEIKYDPSDYDLVAIGTPVWAGNMACAVRAYIQRNRSKFKKLALFCTMGGSGDQNTFKEMEALSGTSAVTQLTVLTREVGRPACEGKIADFAGQLKQ